MRRTAWWYGCVFTMTLCAGCTGGGSGAGGASAPSDSGATSGTGGTGASGGGAVAGQGTSADSSDEPVIAPDEPGAAQVRFDVNSTERHTISPYIYGINNWNKPNIDHLGFLRLGGNRLTAYNWETNASNAGEDWQGSNDDHLCKDCPNCSAACVGTPGEVALGTIELARSEGAAALVTVPILGYVAADNAGPVSPGGDYINNRFKISVPRKNAPFSMTPDPNDAVVYQDEFVNWVKQTFPPDPRAPIFFSLDNEPCLWSSTHPLLRCPEQGGTCAGNPTTYTELVQKNVEYAAAIKDVMPEAKVFGPALYGFDAYQTLQGAPDAAANGNFLDYYLRGLAAAEKKYGRRLVDVLDLHFYTEAPNTPRDRVQAPRSLWDPSYSEASWIVSEALHEPIRLIGRLREQIAKDYPGTELALTEYNYGFAGEISGAVAQADVLGIFGREGLFAASYWPLGSDNKFVDAAFAMYRNYDGNGSAFGSDGVAATTTNDESTSIYASVDPNDKQRLVLVAINKSDATVSAAISVRHTRRLRRAEVYELTAAAPAPTRRPDLDIAKANALTVALPAMSVTTFVLSP